MELLDILIGGFGTAFLVFIFSCLSALGVTWICKFANTKLDIQNIAFCGAGAFPIMVSLAMGYAALNAYLTGFTDNEVDAILMFGLGAILALLLVWPAAYKLAKFAFKLDQQAHR